MNVAVPITTNSNNSEISIRFARSEYYAIINKSSKIIEIISNPYINEQLGAGKKLVQHLIQEYKIDTIIAFELGLKVQQMAADNKLQLIIIHKKNQTLKQILKLMNLKS